MLSSSWDGRPFGHNRHGPKIGWGAVPFFGRWVRELGLHLTQCGIGRGLSSYQAASCFDFCATLRRFRRVMLDPVWTLIQRVWLQRRRTSPTCVDVRQRALPCVVLLLRCMRWAALRRRIRCEQSWIWATGFSHEEMPTTESEEFNHTYTLYKPTYELTCS